MKMIDVAAVGAPAQHYANAVVAGGFAFVSGLLPVDEAGAVVSPGDGGDQARHILGALKLVLSGCGCTLADVVKVSVFLTDISQSAAVARARIEAFGAWRPASTLVEVSGLMVAGAVVEIEAIAKLPS